MPHALTTEQKEQCLNHVYNLIETIKSDPNFMDSIITGDKGWCFAYDAETKRQISIWCSANMPHSKKFLFQKSRVKTILTLFFDSKGVIYYEYVPEGQTVNATFYVQVLGHLCKCIVHVRSEMWRDRKFFLLHGNACLHTAAIDQQFLSKKEVAQLGHPPYSPDLSPPPRLFCFNKITTELKAFPMSDFA